MSVKAEKERRLLYGYKKKSPVACRNCKRIILLPAGQCECSLMELQVGRGSWCRAFEAREVLG